MAPCGKAAIQVRGFCAAALGKALRDPSVQPTATWRLRAVVSAVSVSELPERYRWRPERVTERNRSHGSLRQRRHQRWARGEVLLTECEVPWLGISMFSVNVPGQMMTATGLPSAGVIVAVSASASAIDVKQSLGWAKSSKIDQGCATNSVAKKRSSPYRYRNGLLLGLPDLKNDRTIFLGRQHLSLQLSTFALYWCQAYRPGSVDDALARNQQPPGLLQLLRLVAWPSLTPTNDASLGLELPILGDLRLDALRPTCTRCRIMLRSTFLLSLALRYSPLRNRPAAREDLSVFGVVVGLRLHATHCACDVPEPHAASPDARNRNETAIPGRLRFPRLLPLPLACLRRAHLAGGAYLPVHVPAGSSIASRLNLRAFGMGDGRHPIGIGDGRYPFARRLAWRWVLPWCS